MTQTIRSTSRPLLLVLMAIVVLLSLGCGEPDPESKGESLPADPKKERQQLLARLDRIETSGRSSIDDTTVRTLWHRGERVDEWAAAPGTGDYLEAAFAIDPAARALTDGSFEVRIGLTDQEGTYTELLDRTFPASDAGTWVPFTIDLDAWRDTPVSLSFHKRFIGAANPLLDEFGIAPTDLVVWRSPRTVSRRLDRPNVILISLDTLRPDHLGLENYKRPTSPRIDDLARNGVYFARCFSQAPWTMPSHYSILSGTIPSTSGATSPVQSIVVPEPTVPMLAEILRESGYLTAAFTGAGAVSADLGFDRGFDSYSETELVGGSDVDRVVAKASEWLKRNRSRSFFLFIHSYEPHEPFVDRTFLDQEPRSADDSANVVAKYDGDILRADASIGELLALMERFELHQNTVVLLTSDHGKEFYEKRVPPWDSFAEHGHTLYDEILRVPLIITGPAIPQGSVIDSQVRSIDIAPTILGLAGLSDHASEMEGTDLMPWIRSERSDDLPAYGEATTYGPARDSLRTGGYKLIRRTGLGQLVHPCCSSFPMTPFEELYDLSSDPGETSNLADTEPSVLNQLRSDLVAIGGEATQTTREPAAGDSTPDPETIDSLRSLGYIQ